MNLGNTLTDSILMDLHNGMDCRMHATRVCKEVTFPTSYLGRNYLTPLWELELEDQEGLRGPLGEYESHRGSALAQPPCQQEMSHVFPILQPCAAWWIYESCMSRTLSCESQVIFLTCDESGDGVYIPPLLQPLQTDQISQKTIQGYQLLKLLTFYFTLNYMRIMQRSHLKCALASATLNVTWT